MYDFELMEEMKYLNIEELVEELKKRKEILEKNKEVIKKWNNNIGELNEEEYSQFLNENARTSIDLEMIEEILEERNND